MAQTNKAKAVKKRMLEGIVQDWNRRNPIGTPVLYWPGVMEGPGVASTVRSEAWIMPSGVAVAKVDGYAGGIALTHIGYRDADQAAAAELLRAQPMAADQ